MPVEDRLRSGLEGNARVFVPEGEKRLVEVHRRHRTRTRSLTAVAGTLAVAAVAAGFSLWGADQSSSPEPAQQPSQVVTSADAYTGPRIPDTGWRKVVTRAQLIRAGADSVFLAENLGDADQIPLTLDFVGDVYSQRGRYRGTWVVGDAGTLTYEPDGRVVLTSTAPGCRGCESSFTWRIRGDRLELADLRGTPEDPLARVMFEGIWTKIDT